MHLASLRIEEGCSVTAYASPQDAFRTIEEGTYGDRWEVWHLTGGLVFEQRQPQQCSVVAPCAPWGCQRSGVLQVVSHSSPVVVGAVVRPERSLTMSAQSDQLHRVVTDVLLAHGVLRLTKVRKCLSAR